MMSRVRRTAVAFLLLIVVALALMAGSAPPNTSQQDPDVCVEVDATNGTELEAEQFREVERAFANAGVGNRTIIDYRINNTDVPLTPQANFTYYLTAHDTYESHGECSYMLVTTNTTENIAGATTGNFSLINRDPVVNETHNFMAHIVMHETGHLMGLGPQYEGVDTQKYTIDEYYSVMNYNATYKILTYSNGSDKLGRNEWQIIYEENVLNQSSVD